MSQDTQIELAPNGYFYAKCNQCDGEHHLKETTVGNTTFFHCANCKAYICERQTMTLRGHDL